MINETEKADHIERIKPLIAQARAEGKWLWCSYQDNWMSPDRMEAENAQGHYCWAPENWRLRDPQEHINEADESVRRAQAEAERVRNRVRRSW